MACNATNSAAVDNEGNVWVWGSGKYGLLGDHVKDVNYQVPKILPIQTSSESTGAENAARDAFTRPDQVSQYRVRDMALGQYHMVVVAVDSEVSTQFKPLTYATEIFSKLKNYLINELFPNKVLKTLLEHEINILNDRMKIEHSLKFVFKDDEQKWPQARWATLYNMFFDGLEMNFSESLTIMLEQLQKDLSQGEQGYFILKELRDQILGQRTNTNVVFGWGLADERLCTKSSVSEKAPRRYQRIQIVGQLNNMQVERVSCGNSFSLVLTRKGDVFAWGIGKSGSLGLGEITTVAQIPKILSFKSNRDDSLGAAGPNQNSSRNASEKIIAISSGQTHCLALTEHGGVYSWGNGQGGRLGHGDSIGQNVPEKIRFFESMKVVDIECGDQHSGCINSLGQVFMWGVGMNGRLGLGTDNNREVPQTVTEFNTEPCSRLFFGMNTSFAITKSSELYVWGSGHSGKTGLPSTSSMQLLTPRKLFTLSQKRVAEFAPGPFHTLALTYSGLIYAFGNSREGKLGIKLADQQVSSQMGEGAASQAMVELPTLLTNVPKFSVQGQMQLLFKSYEKFQAYTSEGILVDEEDVKQFKVLMTACGDNSSYYLTNTGLVYASGANDRWQCSDIEEARQNMDLIGSEYLYPDNLNTEELAERGGEVIPVQAAKLIREVQIMQQLNEPYIVPINRKQLGNELQVKHLSAGANHVLVVSVNGQVYGWGDNEYGQLGLGRLLDGNVDNYVSQPTILQDLIDKKILMTASGRSHSLFLTVLGGVYTAGYNEFGQLGIKSEVARLQAQRDDQYGSILNNYLYAKTKSSPQRVDLTNIRFIAAGDSHSLAISDISTENEQKSELYSWGWGAFGQLGHSKIKNYYNLDRPKKVKFRNALDTKVAFVAGGSKHTVCLDLEGRIWYWGNKMSVGIRQPVSKLQFEPILLGPSNTSDVSHFDRGFVFINAAGDSNLVIGYHDDSVFLFGQQNVQRNELEELQDDYQSDDEDGNDSDVDDMNLRMHYTQFEKMTLHNESLTANYVSIGPNHQVATDSGKSIPYTWGTNTCGQLGLGHCKDVQKPSAIDSFKKMANSDEVGTMQFQKLMDRKQQQKSARPDKNSRNGGGGATTASATVTAPATEAEKLMEVVEIEDKKFRFAVQIELHKQNMGVPNTSELLKSDMKVLKHFNKLTQDFHTTCLGVNLSIQSIKARSQDGLITRCHKFPTPIAQLDNINSSIPKSIGRNRQVFEAIYTYLQAHPCYIIRWIKNTKFFEEPEDLKLLLEGIYGKREMKDNRRVLKTMMIIAKAMFDEEYDKNNFKELTSVFRTNSPFRAIFNMIFQLQESNLGFLKEVIVQMLHKTQMSVQRTFEELREKKQGAKAGFDQKTLNEIQKNILLHTLDTLRKRIDLHGGIDLTTNKEPKDQNHLTLEILSLLDYVFNKLVGLAQENLKAQGKDPSSVAQAQNEPGAEEQKGERADESIEQIKRDKIIPYILDLLFENLVKAMDAITYEDILFHYWDVDLLMGVEPDINIFNQKEGQVLLKHVAASMKNYFRGDSTDAAPQLSELISQGNIAERKKLDSTIKHLAGVNFREEIGNTLFTQSSFKPYDLELVLVEQLFDTCIEVENPQISATVSDIVYVYNALVHNEHFIVPTANQKDPLRMLIRELGAKQINLPEKEAMSLRVNLQLSVRFLYKHSAIVKCSDCNAPLIESMLAESRFNESLNGRAWRCKNRSCQKHNPAGRFDCEGCSSSMPAHLFGEDAVFKRFTRVKAKYPVKLLKFVLKTLPLIEEGQDMCTLIDQEVGKMAIESQGEGQRHEKLLKFKAMIEDHSKNEGRSVFNYMKSLGIEITEEHMNNKKLQVMIAEKQFLAQLLEQLNQHAIKKKHHLRLIKDYQTSMGKLSQLPALLKQRTVQTCLNLDQILFNAYTGVSSKFLIEQIEKRGGNFKQIEKATASTNDPAGKKANIKDRVWSGSLHIDLQQLGKKKQKISESEQLFGQSQKAKRKQKTETDLIKEYFDEITTKKALQLRWNAADAKTWWAAKDENDAARHRMQEEAKGVSRELLASASEGGDKIGDAERAITGQIKFIHMERDNVIKSADAQRYDREILKHSDFQFNDNGNGGFLVQLVYNEPSAIPGKNAKIDDAVLESFEISQDILSEMRRNYGFESTFIFGMLQFNVHELVRVINRIVSMNDIFSSLSFDERGFRMKKDPTQEAKPKSKSKSQYSQNVEENSEDEKPKAAEKDDKKQKSKKAAAAATADKSKTKGKKK